MLKIGPFSDLFLWWNLTFFWPKWGLLSKKSDFILKVKTKQNITSSQEFWVKRNTELERKHSWLFEYGRSTYIQISGNTGRHNCQIVDNQWIFSVVYNIFPRILTFSWKADFFLTSLTPKVRILTFSEKSDPRTSGAT